jgi:hypothetical protein
MRNHMHKTYKTSRLSKSAVYLKPDHICNVIVCLRTLLTMLVILQRMVGCFVNVKVWE